MLKDKCPYLHEGDVKRKEKTKPSIKWSDHSMWKISFYPNGTSINCLCCKLELKLLGLPQLVEKVSIKEGSTVSFYNNDEEKAFQVKQIPWKTLSLQNNDSNLIEIPDCCNVSCIKQNVTDEQLLRIEVKLVTDEVVLKRKRRQSTDLLQIFHSITALTNRNNSQQHIKEEMKQKFKIACNIVTYLTPET